MESEPAIEGANEELHLAALSGDLAQVKALLEQGQDPNVFDDMSWTPLHYAVRGNHLEMVRCLLAAGADVNAHNEDKIGDTPLGEVAANCPLDMAKLLVDAGANPAIPGWMGLCALDRAKDRKKPEGQQVFELLVEAARKFKRARYP